MEDKQILVKTIKKSFTGKIKAGITWFKFISAINDIKLTKREFELLAFTNYRGAISSTSSKEEFCKIFKSSIGTVSNMTAKLLRMKLLVKNSGKIKVNPALSVDFTKDFVVRFFISTEEEIEKLNQYDKN
jgi:hypothetical protein